MKILGLDPGRTLGIALLGTDPTSDISPGLRAQQEELPIFGKLYDWPRVKAILKPYLKEADIVVFEDYVVYAGTAGMHVGAHLYVSELIGVITYLASEADLVFVRLPAAKKNRWPDLRLKTRYPALWQAVPRPHSLDALKIALAYAESVKQL